MRAPPESPFRSEKGRGARAPSSGVREFLEFKSDCNQSFVVGNFVCVPACVAPDKYVMMMLSSHNSLGQALFHAWAADTKMIQK